MMSLTRRQREFYEFIRAYIAQHGQSPTYVEISNGMGINPNSKGYVAQVIEALERRGYIRKIYGHARAIEIIEQGVSVRLSPEVERAVAKHARGASLEVATNELLREYLAKVAA